MSTPQRTSRQAQLTVLRDLAIRRHPTTNIAVASSTSLAVRTSYFALQDLAEAGHVEREALTTRTVVWSITHLGRLHLANAQRQQEVAEAAACQAARTSVAGPTYRPATRELYTAPDLRALPARGEAAMQAYRLPSRGLR